MTGTASTSRESETPPRKRTNPFCASRLRPGTLPYLFHDDSHAELILSRCHEFHGWGQIVGRHGSGKSTLIHWMIKQFEGYEIPCLYLRCEPLRSCVQFADQLRTFDPKPGMQLFVDGFEQLPWYRRLLLERQCWKNHCGLVVTAHRSMGFPTLFHTTVTPALAYRIVTNFVQDYTSELKSHGKERLCAIACDDIENLLQRHLGNMREVLFSLYDRFEERSSGPSLLPHAISFGR